MGGSGSNTYVAIVDDDASVCRALARLLRLSGMQAVTYASAEEFLKDEKRPRFDCLVLDIQLAELSGTDLQKHLAAAGQATPIIFITAHDDPKTRRQAERLGCLAYLRKTAPADELLRLIRGVVAQKEQKE
jgi:FixJ family two-component response regulator